MRLAFRPAARGDFQPFFVGRYYLARARDRGDPTVKHEWEALRSHPSSISMVIEDVTRVGPEKAVGFAQAVFVTDTFADLAAAAVEPYINLRLTSCGTAEESILPQAQVREANSGLGLNVLITHWVWNRPAMTEEASRRVRDYLVRQFLTYYSGFKLRQVLMEVFGDEPLQMAINAGFRLRGSYAGYFRDRPRPQPEIQPYMTGVTRREAQDSEGSLISQAFIYTPPCLYFKPHEQDLLCLALLGYSDEELAEPLGITLAAVRKRWSAIYERVLSVDSQLLPAAGDRIRGAEKRRELLAYLRDHPEELRPVDSSARERRPREASIPVSSESSYK